MNTSMKLPASYSNISSTEQETIVGGGSFFKLLSDLLSGFNINLGSGTSRSDTSKAVTTTTVGNTTYTDTSVNKSWGGLSWTGRINLGTMFRDIFGGFGRRRRW